MEREVPLVLKKAVTIVAIDDPLEANATRALLEGLDYQVTVHWVGSRREFIELLAGGIRTEGTVILSCHGGADGIYVPDERPVSPADLCEVAKLGGKTVISLGCMTGSTAFADAFEEAGVLHYVAPTDYPEGRAALGFTANLFFLLASGTDLRVSVERASEFHEETRQFELLV
jgi:hypothetical protein